MMFDTNDLIPVLPELFLLTGACLVLVIDLFLSDDQRIYTYSFAQATLAITGGLVLVVGGSSEQVIFNGSVVRDGITDLLRVSVCLISFGVLLYSKDYLEKRELKRGEFYTLTLFAVLGMMIMIAAGDFLTVYLGLELLSLSLYALVAYERDSGRGAEAAMKYFVLGALASGMLLYGISMIYGATGSINFAQIAQSIQGGGVNETIMVFGIVFVVIGLAFKFGAVPFHMWAPDVYDGAPTAVTMLIGSAPKIAAVAIAIRMLHDGLGGLNEAWSGMLVILAVLSLALGNVVAIAQTNIKRMLAYSTISHVGFIFLGLLAGSASGYASAMFYGITYALTSLGAFGVIILMGRNGHEVENISDFQGLNDRSPWFAGMMLLLLFSMAGVPPTVGFFAKLFVLEAVVRVDLTWLALVAVFFSIIGAFYYIRIIKIMYFDKSEEEAPALVAGMDTRVALSVNGLAVLALGIYPSWLMAWCVSAFG